MKLAAFDFDGTILFDTGIDETVTKAIRTWQDAGHLAVAATGKSLAASQHALDGIDVAFDYSVFFTGAVVTDRVGEVLHAAALAPGTASRLLDGLADVDGIAVYGTTLSGRDVRFRSSVPAGARQSILRDHRELSAGEIETTEFISIPIWVPGDRPLRDRIHRWISERFDVDCVVNPNFLDVIPRGISKASGLQWLARYLGMVRDEVTLYTFGDSWNDLPMHAIADRSFSFPWSPEPVQQATDEVIESVPDTLARLY